MALGSELPALQVKSQFISGERDSRQSPVDKGHPRARSRDDGRLPHSLSEERRMQKAEGLFGTTCACSRWAEDPPPTPVKSHMMPNHNGGENELRIQK